MRSIGTTDRIRTAALLAVFAVAACGGGEPAEEGADESEIAASGENVAGDGSEDGDQMAGGQAAGTAASGAAAGDPAAPGGAAAPATATVLQVQEVNSPGLQAELTEITRKDGVLTVKIRFRNVGTDALHHSFSTGHGAYDRFYVTAGTQKYFVLKDSEGEPLAPKYLDVNLDPGATSTWWAKFPAPPASETTIDLVIPDAPPFEDVPITDR